MCHPVLSLQLKESGHPGVHGVHALQAATQVPEQGLECSQGANHALAAHQIQETVKVSPLMTLYSQENK